MNCAIVSLVKLKSKPDQATIKLMQHVTQLGVVGILMALAGLSPAVMYNRDTGSSKSIELASLPPFSSRANIGGCSAVLIAPNVLLSAAHCTGYAASGTLTANWNGQSRSGAVFTTIGADHMVIVTSTPFDNTIGKMTAPYSGNSENGRLAWKVGYGGNGVIGTGGTGPFYDNIFRAMTNRIEVNNVASPPPAVTTDYLYYDFDGPPSLPQSASRPMTLYEGGTAPGDSGGPLYMYENGRWFVIGVTSGPDAGFYRDGRVRTDMAQIESLTTHSWARPTAPVLEMKWLAQDLVNTVANGAAVTSWPRQGGNDAWNAAAGTATLTHAATPTGNAAVDFPGTARLELPAISNPTAGESAFTVAMVVRVDAAGTGTETSWSDNTGLLDAGETGSVNDWGLALPASGKPGLGIGNPDTTNYNAGSTIADGQWHVIVASWDGSEITGDAVGLDKNISVYVDNASNVTRTQGAEFLNVARNSATLTLGGSRNAARFLDGRMAEVRLYRGALDAAAVDTLIKELKSTHIAPQVGFALTQPAKGSVVLPINQGLVVNGTLTGNSPTVNLTQTSGPNTAVISGSNTLPARLTFPALGTYQFSITATDGSSTLVTPLTVEVVANVPMSAGSSSPVTAAWTTQNIGGANTAGSQIIGSTTASLTGSGMGLEEVSDSIRFAWRPLTGDGTLTARITSFSAANGGKAFGGVMLRSFLDRESTNVAASVISGGGLRFTRRSEEAAFTEPTTHTLRAPYWVRVKRVGNDFTGFRSEDGINWVQQGSTTAIGTMPASALWGLAVTAKTNVETSEVKYDNILLEPLAGQAVPANTWTGADIGAPTVAGSNSITGSVRTVSGSGENIGGTTDQFHYLSQPYSGDAQLTARVVSQDMSTRDALAGVMVRASTAATAENAFTAVTPLDGLSFQSRATASAVTVSNSAGTKDYIAPYWVRLTRVGNVFTCFRSTDGSAWIQLGPAVTIADAPATMFAGLHMASVNNNGNSVANFDNVSLIETSGTLVSPAITFAAGQNPSVANNFTLAATVDRPSTWSWQKVSGPGTLTFATQNTATPQTAFTAAGTYVIRVTAEANGVATFQDQTLDLTLDARWDFNSSLEGWATANPAIAAVSNGMIRATVTSNDPQVFKSNAVYVSGNLAKHLLVRYRSTASGSCVLYFGNIATPSFSSTRIASGGYTVATALQGVLINPSAHVDWSGQIIKDFRIDPSGGLDSVYEIDWIALSDGDFDNDGLTDIQETGADPDNDGLPNFEDTDSNNDGLPDGSLPPADVDQDGYSDHLEVTRYWNASPLTKSWQTVTADWNTGALGSATQSAWNPGDNVIFDQAAAYTVTLASAVAPGQVSFLAGQVTLAGSGSIKATTISVLSGATLTATGDQLFAPGTTTFTVDGSYASSAVSSTSNRLVSLKGGGQITAGALRVADGSFAGGITGSSSLLKETSGTLVLTGANTFTGASTITAGTLQIGSGGTTGSLGTVAISNSGNLVFNRSDATTWAGSLSGGGSLTKSGTNTLTLTGNHSHSGTTIISGGILEIGNGGTSGSLGTGPLTNAGLVRFNRSDASSCAATITGGTFAKLGAGTLTLSGNNTFGTGTLTLGSGNTNVGYLRLAHPKALGNHTKVSLASGTSGVSGIEVIGGNTYGYAIDTVGRNTAAGAVMLRNVSGSNVWQGNITIISGGGGYEIESSAGLLTITGNIGVSIAGQAARALNVSGAGDVTFAGPLTDLPTTAIALNKSGAGVLRLNHTNTHAGATSVTLGTLLVNGSMVSAINATGGATLGGTGQIATATLNGSSAAAASTISPGDGSVESLTATGTVTLGTNSRYVWELSDWNGSANSFDQLLVSNLALASTPAAPLVIAITPRALTNYSAVGRVFPIAVANNPPTGFSAAAISLDASAIPDAKGTWSVRLTGNTLELVFTPSGFAGWIAGYPQISDPAPAADPDGDGWTNEDEWIIGTDPTSGFSRFTATVSASGLAFTRTAGRSYEILTSVNLGQWTSLGMAAEGTGPVTIPHPANPGQRRFYKVAIRQSP